MGAQRRGHLIVAACMIALAGCTLGSGEVVEETRQVSGFSEVVLQTSGDVDVEVGGSESITIVAQDDILPVLTTEVVDGRLILDADRPFTTSRGVTYRVTASDLDGVTVAGSGDVDVTGIDTDAFRATISGSGSITTSGSATDLDVTISGSGEFEGEDLQVDAAAVTVSGSGDATVNATETLGARISGSGDVDYLGDPAVDQTVTGSGSVSPR